MRIVLQGSMTMVELLNAIQDIVSDTLEKAQATPKEELVHNPVIEFTLNVEGTEEPVLIVDEETQTMLTVHQGVKNGELVEYVPPNRQELVEKFDRMLEEAQRDLDPEAEVH